MTVPYDLEDRVVLVTGSSSGIGRATATAFGRQHAKVAITYHSDEAGARDTADSVRNAGGDALVVQYDMTDTTSVERTIDAVRDRWGTLSTLVNNAVPSTPGDRLEATALEDWRDTVDGIQTGVFHTTKTALPMLTAAPWGRIVTVTSLAANGTPGHAAYGTAKAGLHGLTKLLSKEVGREGVLSNAIAPGFVLTESVAERLSAAQLDDLADDTPSGTMTTPEDVANLAVFLGSRANGNVNGEVVRIAGGSR